MPVNYKCWISSVKLNNISLRMPRFMIFFEYPIFHNSSCLGSFWGFVAASLLVEMLLMCHSSLWVKYLMSPVLSLLRAIEGLPSR